jgi:hypothetical protein
MVLLKEARPKWAEYLKHAVMVRFLAFFLTLVGLLAKKKAAVCFGRAPCKKNPQFVLVGLPA